MRARLACLALLALAACSRDDGPLLDSRTPPALGPRFFPPDGWSFGVLATPKTPQLRYGQVAASGPPRADVVILPAYGESAEVYYETARDLTARAYNVWVLEAAGQGGSQRFPGATDLGRSNGFGVDAAALQGFLLQVVRPGPGRPVVIAASGASALTALLAAEHGLKPSDGLFLWSPDLTERADVARAQQMTTWRLGGLRAAGAQSWARPTVDLSGRSTLPAAWQLANPDLRMGGPAWEWIAAEDEARREALSGRSRLNLPVELLASAAAAANLCAGAPHCHFRPLPASDTPAHLAADPVRKTWLDALAGFVELRISERSHSH